jgi:hypothetical protein
MTSWTTPKTWSAATLTSAELNTHVRDNLSHLYERVVGYAPTTSSDVTRASATFADLDVLSFPVATGKNYTFMFIATWSHSNTGGGPIFSFDHPGGNARALFEYTGETSNISDLRDWVTSIDGGAGVATVDTIDVARICVGHGRYTCTSSGTFKMRYARNTTGTLTVQAGASLFVTSD